MEAILAICIGVLVSCGVYLLLRARTFPVVVGLIMLAYAVDLFLFAAGGLHDNAAVVIGQSEQYADPLPQALVLTSIVIGFAMTAYVVVLSLRARKAFKDDHVDASEGEESDDAVR